jgi:ribosome maturation factor RimP
MEILQRLMELAEPLLDRRGLELLDVECRRERRGLVVRFFVDRPGGVDLDTLAEASREISDHLDVADPIAGRYTLEVSSPGINRPLRRREHFLAVAGRRVRVRTRTPRAGQRNFLGTLREVGETAIAVEIAPGRTVTIAYSEIERANYEHDFSAEDFHGSTPRPLRE